jgi:hypothetical protein
VALIRKKETHPVGGVGLAVQPNDLDDSHLQRLVQGRYSVIYAEDILDGFRHGALGQEYEGVAFACGVRFSDKKSENEFRGIRNEVLEFPVDRVDGENGVLSDV